MCGRCAGWGRLLFAVGELKQLHRGDHRQDAQLGALLLAQQRLMLLRSRVHPLLIPAARATHDVSEATELACAVQAAPDGVVEAWRASTGASR